jgi:hypothetical protein
VLSLKSIGPRGAAVSRRLRLPGIALAVSALIVPAVLAPGGPASAATASLPVFGVLTPNGDTYAEAGGLQSGFDLEATGQQQISVAGDSADAANAPIIGEVDDSGDAWVKAGALNAQWTEVYSASSSGGPAKEIAVTDGFIAVVTVSGDLYTTLGPIITTLTGPIVPPIYPWTTLTYQADGIQSAQVAFDPSSGPVLAALTTGGSLLVKTGPEFFAAGSPVPVINPFPFNTVALDVTQFSVAADANGPLLGWLSTNGNAWVIQGSLAATPDLELNQAQEISVATDTVNGPLIAADVNDTVIAKEGSLTAGWDIEATGIPQVQVASDPQTGPVIAIVDSSGDIGAKEGSLTAGWSAVFAGPTSQLSVAG